MSVKTLHIFCGLSISHARAQSLAPNAYIHPPVQRFSLPQLLEQFPQPGIIAIIDGFFHSRESCSLTEIRNATDVGWEIFGASSMGVLRAVEAEPLGMKGIGRVFRWFKLFQIEDDDEVAQTMNPDTYQATSLAMVDIRALVQDLRKTRVLSADSASEVLRICKSTYYPERSKNLVLETLATYVKNIDLRLFDRLTPKQKDAEQLVKLLAKKNFDSGPRRQT